MLLQYTTKQKTVRIKRAVFRLVLLNYFFGEKYIKREGGKLFPGFFFFAFGLFVKCQEYQS